MLSFLPAPLLLLFSLPVAVFNTAFWAVLIALVSPFKLLPYSRSQQALSRMLNGIFFCWVEVNRGLFSLINDLQWHVEGDVDSLSRDNWYLVLSNHQSWMDIPVLAMVFNRRIPALKFFLKQQLIWVPFVGFGAWALDMPFMRRFTPQQLKKKPHLKGKDIESTRRSCEKFRAVPTSVLNFVEGTRSTEHKRQQRQSPYRFLLRPKAGGIAFALSAMGDQFDQVLNVTLCYPDNRDGRAMIDLLSGRVKRIMVHVECIRVSELPQGNYSEDPRFRSEFQQWLNRIWQRKDERLIAWHSPGE